MQTRKMRSMNIGFLYDKKGKNASMFRLADAGGVSKSYQTAFIVTVRGECRRREFDVENDNMHGHWTGIFSGEDGVTTIDFTEDEKTKKWFMKPFIGAYLKKHQALYITDLKKALEHTYNSSRVI